MPPPERAEGVDVSNANAGLDWFRIARAGVSFAIVKLTEGEWIDPRRIEHVTGARNADLIVGGYHFARLEGDPQRQAKMFAQTARALGLYSESGAVLDVPPVIDVEDISESRCNGTPTRAYVREWIRVWVETAEVILGRRCVLYTGQAYGAQLGIESSARFDLWVAHYGARSPGSVPPWGHDWSLWQYAGNTIRAADGRVVAPPGLVDGAPGEIDRNKFAGDDSDLRAWCAASVLPRGLNP
jgi:lysozyme